MGNRSFVLGNLEDGSEFPRDVSSPKVSSQVEFPSAEPLHTGRAGTRGQIARLKKKNPSSQDGGKDSGHMPGCPVAPLQR